jgi:DNA-binding FrmR family transcriptional regulator
LVDVEGQKECADIVLAISTAQSAVQTKQSLLGILYIDSAIAVAVNRGEYLLDQSRKRIAAA